MNCLGAYQGQAKSNQQTCVIHNIDARVYDVKMITIPSLSPQTAIALRQVDEMRRSWESHLATLPDSEVQEMRKRGLRRHAIETGIIEGLYDLSAGETESLAESGIEKENFDKKNREAMRSVSAQYDSLLFLQKAITDGRPFSTSLIRELHSAIAQGQPTFEGVDQFGVQRQVPLRGGVWKTINNSITRTDGSKINFTAPEFVQDEIDQMVKTYLAAAGKLHPIALASWLHHSLIIIHPFPDGNGRVARALVLFVLYQAGYAPIVIDRSERERYLDALTAADRGDMGPLIRLFARLQQLSLMAEIAGGKEQHSEQSVDVARAVFESRGRQIASQETTIARQTANVAFEAQNAVVDFLREWEEETADSRKNPDGTWATKVFIDRSAPPLDDYRYHSASIFKAAKRSSFYSNISEGCWFTKLKVALGDKDFIYLVFIQRVGPGVTGVLAITVHAELKWKSPKQTENTGSNYLELLESFSANDVINLTSQDDISERKADISELLNRTLAAALANFMHLGS